MTGVVELIFYTYDIDSLSLTLGAVSTTAAESLSKPLLLKEETGAIFDSSAAFCAGLRLLWFDAGFAAGSKLLYVLDSLSLFSEVCWYVSL